MCRIASYIGPQIPLENIVTAPKHSLLSQSEEATESKISFNGDGFGIAWYSHQKEPGLYRECLPAWSDENLINLCRMLQSHLFIAHVRASTTGETMRSNCHPFTYKNWSFAHNGQIGHFELVKRDLESVLSDSLYLARRGTTDSEVLFLLLLNEGLEECPVSACIRSLEILEGLRKKLSLSAPLRLVFVFSNGETLYGVRYASDAFCPTLYCSENLDNGGVSLASEPLDGNSDNWTAVETSTLIEVSENHCRTHKLVTG
ncbi:MAG: class II glutamine amidotransferase [Pseudomonadota bacterium]